jgi:hypothetical protein
LKRKTEVPDTGDTMLESGGDTKVGLKKERKAEGA